ncbi:serine/threonine protein kinase, partial [Streptomyces sp. SMC 277]|nr:serine/threonine protein kinase [Streptomyces antimicrobicus]
LRRAALVAVVAAVLGGAGVFGVLRMTGQDAGGSGQGQDSTRSSRDGDGKAPLPAGWTEVKDQAGFTLYVPNGWRRQTDGNQIDYTPDNGKHFIRIAVDTTPDYENPYMHVLDLEKQVSRRTDYKRQKLNQNTFRDSTRSAIWEFTWTEKGVHAGPRRSIEQMYIAPDGTEYAVYMSGPAADWEITRAQFDTVLSGWAPATG